MMTIQETIDRFISQYNMERRVFDIPSFYYCGITENLDRRASEHNVSKYIASVTCDSFETACEIEKGLHKAGFDTGKQLGNGTKDSIYVYMCRKSQYTKE